MSDKNRQAEEKYVVTIFSCLLCQILVDLLQRLTHCLVNQCIRLFLLVHIIERNHHMAILLHQDLFVQSICLSHLSAKVIAIYSPLKKRFRSPNQYAIGIIW